jgi:hypothetical protein
VTAVPQFAPVAAPPDAEGLRSACVDAAEILARKGGAASSAAEAKDFSAAVLNFAQALAVMSPETDVNGVPLQHERQMAQDRAALEMAKIKEQAKAQAPTPSRKTVSVSRDQHGRANNYSVEDS